MELFAENGFSGATISEVERRVGLAVGTGSLYRHFSSKEELLRAAVEREVTRIRLEIQRHAEAAEDSAEDPVERRLRSYRQRLHDMRQCDRLFRLMLNEGDRVPELREAMWAALRVPVKHRPETGDVIEAVAESAIGGYHLFSIMQGRPYNGVGEEQFLRELVELTMAGPGLRQGAGLLEGPGLPEGPALPEEELPAVADDRLPGYVGRRLAGEEHHRPRHVLLGGDPRDEQPLEFGAGRHLLFALNYAQGDRLHRHVAHAERVHPDPQRRQVLGERLGHGDDRAARRPVVEQVAHAVGGRRGVVDDGRMR
jgi:AcrR family transcriptional regulator